MGVLVVLMAWAIEEFGVFELPTLLGKQWPVTLYAVNGLP